MKRPFALLGGVSFLAVILAACMDADLVLSAATICLGLGIGLLPVLAAVRVVCKRMKHPRSETSGVLLLRAVCFALTLLVSGFCMLRYVRAYETTVAPAEELAGSTARIRGIVLDYPREQYQRYYYQVRVERLSADGQNRDIPDLTLRISTAMPFGCRPYDSLECTVKIFSFSDAGTLYSSRNSRLAEGISAGAYISNYDSVAIVPNTASPPGKLFAEFRRILARQFERRLPGEESGMIRALLLGEREQVSDEVYGDFQEIGASHLLVISGLHMAALGGFLSLLFGSLPLLGKRVKNLLTAGAILGFLALTGFPVSAVRSGIMYLLALLANCLGKRADGVNSLGFAVLLICVRNPFSGGDVGFALSVLATLGILVLSGPMTAGLMGLVEHHPRIIRMAAPVASSLGVTLSAILFTLPVQFAVFQSLTLLAPLSSLLLVFPCTALLYCSLAAAFLGLLPVLSGLSAPFFFCAGWLARISIKIAGQLSKIRHTVLDLSDPIWMVGAAGIALVVLAGFLLKRGRRAACVVLASLLLLFGNGRALAAISLTGTVTMAAAADSSCVVILQGDRAAVLTLGGFQTGAARELLLRHNVRKVELLCLPVRDRDAREAAAQVLERFSVEQLALPKDAYLGRELQLLSGRAKRLYPEEGETVEVLGGVKITFAEDMSRLTVRAGSVSAIVETGQTGAGSCQLLFTTAERTEINSSFTVLQNDDIIEEHSRDVLAEQLPGQYLLPDGVGLLIDLLPDGTLRFRGDSLCLK